MEIHRAKNIQDSHEEEQGWKLLLSKIKTYYKATIIKTVWYWCNGIKLINGSEMSPGVDLHTYN